MQPMSLGTFGRGNACKFKSCVLKCPEPLALFGTRAAKLGSKMQPTYGLLVDIWTCEVTLHCFCTQSVMDSGVVVRIFCPCCMLDNVVLLY